MNREYRWVCANTPVSENSELLNSKYMLEIRKHYSFVLYSPRLVMIELHMVWVTLESRSFFIDSVNISFI